MALCKERLENYVETHWQDKAAVSVYCRPLDGGDDFFYRDRVMPSASLIKVPIMACVFRKEKEGQLSFDATYPVYGSVEGGSFYDLPEGTEVSLRTLVFHMIVESDNTCTNMLIDVLGFDAVNEEIRRQGMEHTLLRRKMMDFEAARQGKENVTSPGDMGRLFLRLASGTCVDGRRDEAMRAILAQQEDNCILPAQIPNTVAVEHKTGELDGIYHDCGLVWKQGRPYVCCLMADGIVHEAQAIYDMSYLARFLYDEI